MNSSKLKGNLCIAMLSFASLLRFLRICIFEHLKCCSLLGCKSYGTPEKKQSPDEKVFQEIKKSRNKRQKPMGWKCVDNCCWIVGYLCTTSWLLLFLLYIVPVSLPGLKGPEIPGARLKREGLVANHPVVLVPGIITGGLELWEGKPCAEPLFRKRLWGGWGSGFTDIFRRLSFVDISDDILSLLNWFMVTNL